MTIRNLVHKHGAVPSGVPIHRDLAVRLSVTETCQLRCTYCLPENRGSGCPGSGNNRTVSNELSSADLLRLLELLHLTHGIRRLRFTGGEPLLRRDLNELIHGAARLGIEDLALTTNGQLLARRAGQLRGSGLKRVNISLDSRCPETFRRVTRGARLEATLAGIEAALEYGFHPVKLNTVVLRGVNDLEVEGLLEYALERGICIRFLELMPVGEGVRFFDEQFVSTAETLDRLRGAGFTLEATDWDPRETSRDYRVRAPGGSAGSCGFISPTSQPFCGGCGRIRLTSQGRLYGCLARAGYEDLQPLLNLHPNAASQALNSAMTASFNRKQAGPRFRQTVNSMALLGG